MGTITMLGNVRAVRSDFSMGGAKTSGGAFQFQEGWNTFQHIKGERCRINPVSLCRLRIDHIHFGSGGGSPFWFLHRNVLVGLDKNDICCYIRLFRVFFCIKFLIKYIFHWHINVIKLNDSTLSFFGRKRMFFKKYWPSPSVTFWLNGLRTSFWTHLLLSSVPVG